MFGSGNIFLTFSYYFFFFFSLCPFSFLLFLKQFTYSYM
jgi:hypothetical protein